jgi:cell division protein ZapE
MSESDDYEKSTLERRRTIGALSPREHYERDLRSSKLIADAGQARAIEHVERLYHDLVAAQRRQVPGFIHKILGFKRSRTEPVRGLYLWGSVGRGKTHIVDTFFDCLPTEKKLRIHFHSFMRKVHGELQQLQRESDPLAAIAGRWARRLRILCLDEFHVGDITDAMILGNLLAALFDNGVSLVATSNEAPKDLYRDGLQRDRFLPAIALLEKHVAVVELTGETDYRLRALEQAGVYYTPHSEAVADALGERFTSIAPEPGMAGGAIDIDGREIATRRHADGVVWFDFATLCGGPRATGDYIEIALCHHTVVLSEVPVMDDDSSDAARRFINLIDELYDRDVNLVVSAAAWPEQLYLGSRLEQPFKRSASRLREMQSHAYLSRPHRCD